MRRAALALTVVVVVATAACPKPAGPASPPPSSPSPPPTPTGAGQAGQGSVDVAAATGEGEETEGASIRSVFPPLEGAPHPLAERACAALQDVPQQKRDACCERARPPSLGASECRRMLSAALTENTVTLDERRLGECEAAVAVATEGCGWVKPRLGLAPPSCLDLFTGTRALNQSCRSSLECVGSLVCRGLSATSAGVCQPAAKTGVPCGGGIDPLAVYTRQHDADRRHPPCEGFCGRGRCQDAVKLGAPCKGSLHCGPAAFCDGQVCRAGHQKEGGPCADSGCAPGLSCVAHTCRPLLAAGEPCSSDLQCEGGCVRAPGAASGTCGMQCWARVGGP